MADISWNRAGNVACLAARDITISPDSKGSRSASNTFAWNSGSSSKNNTPLCAKEISPGLGGLPPPTRATAEALWCGVLKGRFCQSSGWKPKWLIDCTAAASDASFCVKWGRMLNNRLANSVLPLPGGPTNNTLWPALAAISKTRRAWCCPFTSAMSL